MFDCEVVAVLCDHKFANAKRCRAESRQRGSVNEKFSLGDSGSQSFKTGSLKLSHRWLLTLNSVSAGELKVSAPTRRCRFL